MGKVDRVNKVGATLTNLLLPTIDNCYPTFGDENYHKAYAIGWNLYRCSTCAARREPERWWHKALFKLSRGRYNPFSR